jgi:flagellar M-ring protein FliF
VILKVSPVGRLERGKVAAITHLVASAVEGLDPGRVTVLDQNGTLLSSGSDESMANGASNSQLELQKNVENYLQEKAQTLLDGVLGTGRSIVRVNAQLNFEQAEKTIEEYDPDNLAIVSQQQTTEKNKDNATSPEGGGEGGESTVETAVTNYEVSRTVQRIVSAVGTIERLTVSVIVDGVPETSGAAGGDVAPALAPRSQEELNSIGALVKGAVGLQPERNDHIEVLSVLFDNTGMEQERQELEKIEEREFYYDVGRKVGYGLAFLLAAFIALRIVKKSMRALKTLMPPMPQRAYNAGVPPIEDDDPSSVQPQRRKVKLTDQMAQAAREKPDEVARAIKTMMTE